MVLLILALLFNFQGDERVIHMRCGDGLACASISHEVPDGFVLGLDERAEMIDRAEETYDPDLFHNLQFQQATLEQLSSTYDLIISPDTPDRTTLVSIALHLRDGGKAVLPRDTNIEELKKAGLRPVEADEEQLVVKK